MPQRVQNEQRSRETNSRNPDQTDILKQFETMRIHVRKSLSENYDLFNDIKRGEVEIP